MAYDSNSFACLGMQRTRTAQVTFQFKVGLGISWTNHVHINLSKGQRNSKVLTKPIGLPTLAGHCGKPNLELWIIDLARW